MLPRCSRGGPLGSYKSPVPSLPSGLQPRSDLTVDCHPRAATLEPPLWQPAGLFYFEPPLWQPAGLFYCEPPLWQPAGLRHPGSTLNRPSGNQLGCSTLNRPSGSQLVEQPSWLPEVPLPYLEDSFPINYQIYCTIYTNKYIQIESLREAI